MEKIIESMELDKLIKSVYIVFDGTARDIAQFKFNYSGPYSSIEEAKSNTFDYLVKDMIGFTIINTKNIFGNDTEWEVIEYDLHNDHINNYRRQLVIATIKVESSNLSEIKKEIEKKLYDNLSLLY